MTLTFAFRGESLSAYKERKTISYMGQPLLAEIGDVVYLPLDSRNEE